MAVSEGQQSRRAMEEKGQFDKVRERLQAAQDKVSDPATPDWEKKEMHQKISQMGEQLDKMVKRQSTSEPPPPQPAMPDQPGQSTASSGGVSQSGPQPGSPGGPQPSHVVTPVKPEDKK